MAAPPHPPLPGSTSPSLGSTGSLSSLDDLDITSLPFEGPEKTLEVQFVPKADHPRGLRCLPRSALDQICGRARCTIVSQMSNAYLDAYVLSEVRNELLGTESCEEGTLPLKNTLSLSHLSHVQTSSLAFAQLFFFFFPCLTVALYLYRTEQSSLFVYPYMIILKTCGTTTLLRCVKTLLRFACDKNFLNGGLQIEWMGYSRKNFTFPELQLREGPHTSFQRELEYISKHEDFSTSLKGNGYTLGPVTGDHWFVFVADKTIRNDLVSTDRVLNVMMFDIDEELASKFYYDQYRHRDVNGVDAKSDGSKLLRPEVEEISHKMLTNSGLTNLCPGAMIDPRAFEPCGFSMNAIIFKSYSTVHVTPEKESSYASFETNQPLRSYGSLINNVVRLFRPKRFVLTLMADEGGINVMSDNPLAPPSSSKRSAIVVNEGGNIRKYLRKSLASIQVEDDTCCMMGNFVLEGEWGDTSTKGVENLNEAVDEDESRRGRPKDKPHALSFG
mgnify:FL=1